MKFFTHDGNTISRNYCIAELNPSDTKGFGTTSDTKGGGGATPLLSHSSPVLGT